MGPKLAYCDIRTPNLTVTSFEHKNLATSFEHKNFTAIREPNPLLFKITLSLFEIRFLDPLTYLKLDHQNK